MFLNNDDLQIAVVRAEIPDTSDIFQIAEELKLSYWKHQDYALEINNPESICLVAKYKEKTIGFLIARLIMTSLNPNDSFCEIYNIGILESFQNKGYAKQILNELINICLTKHIKEIWLEVRKGNKKARTFYAKNGFIEEYVRKNYYSNPVDDAIVLKLTLI